MSDLKKHLFLWDGDCSVCQECADWLIKVDRRNLFDVKPHQEITEDQLAQHCLTHRECKAEVKVITNEGTVLGASEAINYFLSYYKPWNYMIHLLERFPGLLKIERFLYERFSRKRLFFSRLMSMTQRWD